MKKTIINQNCEISSELLHANDDIPELSKWNSATSTLRKTKNIEKEKKMHS